MRIASGTSKFSVLASIHDIPHSIYHQICYFAPYVCENTEISISAQASNAAKCTGRIDVDGALPAREYQPSQGGGLSLYYIRVRGPERRYGPSGDRIVVVVVVLGFLVRSTNYNKGATAAMSRL